MPLTNKLSLPQPLVDAVARDGYRESKPGTYSVTRLISPPRISILTHRHFDHLEEDASDRIFTLLGKAIHTILEKAAGGDHYETEKRLAIEIGDFKVTGQIDVYDRQKKVLQDYKLTSYHALNDGIKPEWEAQSNCYRLLLETNGFPVERAEIVAIYRDWSQMRAGRTHDYPEHQVQVFRVNKWPEERTREYLWERLQIHQQALDGELPLCSPVERWERPARHALMKKGAKRAIRLYDNDEQAQAALGNAKEGGKNHFTEFRPGENVRCMNYCPVTAYCDFGRQLIQDKAESAK